MRLNEIRESGLLELYVLGELNKSEKETVLKAISFFPELKKELTLIENAFLFYAKLHAIKPDDYQNNGIIISSITIGLTALLMLLWQ